MSRQSAPRGRDIHKVRNALRVWLAACATFALVGCANDNYRVVEGGPGSPASLKSDLHDCKNTVIAKFQSEQPTHYNAAMGAVVGGAFGAALGGELDASTQKTDYMKPGEIDPAIERCMADKGYSGTSEN